jgi:hypothetical protein
MKARAAFLGLLLLFGVGTFGVGNASAQAKKKFVSKPGTSKYTQTHIIDVDDVPNHQLRLFELHSVYTGDAPDFDGVKVKERFARAVSDYIEGRESATLQGPPRSCTVTAVTVVTLMGDGDPPVSTFDRLSSPPSRVYAEGTNAVDQPDLRARPDP